MSQSRRCKCKKIKDIPLTNEQTWKALKLCLDNVADLLDLAALHITTKRYRLLLFVQFALEEAGKAMIIMDKLANPNEVVITTADCIYDHETKMLKALERIDLPDEWHIIREYFRPPVNYEWPDSVVYFAEDRERLIGTAKHGHRVRLESLFVEFDPITRDPYIATNVDWKHWTVLYKSTAKLQNQLRREVLDWKKANS
ncbi:MAG TPA: AbiV family abortive infection protein, partial [Nitrososphaera sp.]|nr:AbiV family abortive infection protein [Nitrososphaera sp.]